MTTREIIEDFLHQKRLAMVGVSRNPKDFTRRLFRELRERDYDVVPVNPHVREVDGQRCFARVQDIVPLVEGAFLMTRPETTAQVVKDCARAGISRVWIHRGGDALTQAAVDFCHQNGIRVVSGFCPYMFLPRTQFFHRLHAFFMKLAGRYPK